MTSTDHQRSRNCYEQWMMLQEQQLSELQEALDLKENGDDSYVQLVEKSINSFQDYIDKRNQLSLQDASGLIAPSWNTALENSLLWVGGCRPSIFIRLTYALCGSQDQEIIQLPETLLQDVITRGNFGQISAAQLRMINSLHMKTIKEEERLSNQLASLQEKIADHPIAVIARGLSRVGESSEEIDGALDEHENAMVNMLQQADKLRLNTLKELLGILTPAQGANLLAAGKKLHLCLHEWGKTRDHRHGRI